MSVYYKTGNHYASGSVEACTAVSDDALFRDKLKHMGKCKSSLLLLRKLFVQEFRTFEYLCNNLICSN